MKFILVGKSKVPFFLCKSVYTIGFDSHFHAYEIEIDNSEVIDYKELTGYYINDLLDVTPTIPRTVQNYKTYATLRHALKKYLLIIIIFQYNILCIFIKKLYYY